MKRLKQSPKKQTSGALDEITIQKLKIFSKKQGIPYKVLLRVLYFIQWALYQAVKPNHAKSKLMAWG